MQPSYKPSVNGATTVQSVNQTCFCRGVRRVQLTNLQQTRYALLTPDGAASAYSFVSSVQDERIWLSCGGQSAPIGSLACCAGTLLGGAGGGYELGLVMLQQHMALAMQTMREPHLPAAERFLTVSPCRPHIGQVAPQEAMDKGQLHAASRGHLHPASLTVCKCQLLTPLAVSPMTMHQGLAHLPVVKQHKGHLPQASLTACQCHPHTHPVATLMRMMSRTSAQAQVTKLRHRDQPPLAVASSTACQCHPHTPAAVALLTGQHLVVSKGLPHAVSRGQHHVASRGQPPQVVASSIAYRCQPAIQAMMMRRKSGQDQHPLHHRGHLPLVVASLTVYQCRPRSLAAALTINRGQHHVVSKGRLHAVSKGQHRAASKGQLLLVVHSLTACKCQPAFPAVTTMTPKKKKGHGQLQHGGHHPLVVASLTACQCLPHTLTVAALTVNRDQRHVVNKGQLRMVSKGHHHVASRNQLPLEAASLTA